jgi:hypothetical protein
MTRLHIESHNDWRLIPQIMQKPKLNKEHEKLLGQCSSLIGYIAFSMGRNRYNKR